MLTFGGGREEEGGGRGRGLEEMERVCWVRVGWVM